MKVFAISDLHLSSAVKKPMNIFGGNWDNHFEKISADWRAKVGDADLVLLGGDMSWGLTMDEAAPDFALVAALSGKKIVGKGNHDLYWQSLSKMRTRFSGFEFLQNNAIRVCPEGCDEGVVVAGSRGWTIPASDTKADDVKIYKRELLRLEMSLQNAEQAKRSGDTLIAMLHFPPFDATYQDTEVTALLEKYDVDFALYGHLHGKNVRVNPKVTKGKITYFLTSCDLIGNSLVEVCEIKEAH